MSDILKMQKKNYFSYFKLVQNYYFIYFCKYLSFYLVFLFSEISFMLGKSIFRKLLKMLFIFFKNGNNTFWIRKTYILWLGLLSNKNRNWSGINDAPVKKSDWQ